jgi:hypothetical protein
LRKKRDYIRDQYEKTEKKNLDFVLVMSLDAKAHKITNSLFLMRDGVPTRKSARLGNAAQVSALEDGQSTARDPAQGKGTLRMTDVDTTTSSPTPSATCNCHVCL